MAKIAISIPDEMLRVVEAERRASGESRSEFFRHAVEAFLRQRREYEAVEQYMKGYQQHPESENEIALAESTLVRALEETPWDDEQP